MLSFKKLENLLSNKGFIINSIFIVDGYVTYLDVSSFKSVENFILYIPSNYDIKIDDGNIENVYKINNIEMNENGEIVKNCIDDLDDADIEKDYNEIDLDYNTETNLEEHLKDNYNRPVLLKNTKKDDINQCKYILNQLSRLRLCVQNLKYKLSIIYKNYLCCIKRDDSLVCFLIKDDYNSIDKKKLFITLDLEILFKEKENKISNDVKTIRESIYKILNNNQIKHSKILNDMISELNKTNMQYEIILNKNKKYEEYIIKLELLFNNNQEAEKNVSSKLFSIREEYTNKKGLHYDIERSHLISKHEREIDDINENRKNIIKNINDIKLLKENMILEVDKILFDNSIMINTVITNIQKLSKII